MASGSSKHLPLTSYPVTISPLRLLCVLVAYEKHAPKTWHMPWMSLKQSGIDQGDTIKAYNAKGFIRDQRLQPHRLSTIPLQDERVFPRCKSVCRAENDEKMYPQHGDLESAMFKRCRHAGEGVLRKRRSELVRQRDYNGIKALDVEEVEESEIGKSNEVQAEASLNGNLVEKMEAELQQAEEKRKAAREARRANRQKREPSP